MSKEINKSYDTDVNVLLAILQTKLYNRFGFSNITYTEWNKNSRNVKYTINPFIKQTIVNETQTIITMSKKSYIFKCVQIYDNLPFATTLYIKIVKNGTKTLMNIIYDLSYTKKCWTKALYNKWIENNISSVYDRFNKTILESI